MRVNSKTTENRSPTIICDTEVYDPNTNPLIQQAELISKTKLIGSDDRRLSNKKYIFVSYTTSTEYTLPIIFILFNTFYYQLQMNHTI